MAPPNRTVYVSIGNSDNKLTQAQWAEFCRRTLDFLQGEALAVHGVWYSATDAPYQNAAICFEINAEQQATPIKEVLQRLALAYHQDSIAWATAQTEFLQPDYTG
ncbi:MAG: hypothetical protein ACRDVE_20620 [Actinocrinis sp.]